MKAGKASNTAEAVLAALTLTAMDPATSHLVRPDLATFAKAAFRRVKPGLAFGLRFGAVRAFGRRKEEKTLPGFATHIATRKATIREWAEEIRPKALVVMGAGYDALGYLLAEDCRVIEVDSPATQLQKKMILRGMPDRPIEFVPLHISKKGAQWSVEGLTPRTTLAVAEGLTMYLTLEENTALFRKLGELADRIIFTHLVLDPSGQPNFISTTPELQNLLRKSSEPFLWGCDPWDVPAFLDLFGFEEERMASYPDVSGLIEGERIVMAKRKGT